MRTITTTAKLFGINCAIEVDMGHVISQTEIDTVNRLFFS